MEYGIFNDEGLIEDGFIDPESAEEHARLHYAEDDVHVAAICHDHPDQEADNCEECNAEEEV